MYYFSVNGADNKDLSNLVLFRNTSKVISEVDLLVKIGISTSSVRLHSFK